MAPSGFGPRVIGEQEYEEEEEVREEAAHVFGDRVLGNDEDTARATAAPDPRRRNQEDEPDGGQQQSATDQLEEALPEGYTYEKAGGYYALEGPEGEPIESDTPSGKWQGAEATLKAARQHAAEKEAEAKEQAEKEAETEERWDDETAPEASIEEVRDALEANPSTELIDLFMRAELQREAPIRPEVLDAIEDAERQREDPRDEVFSTVDSLRAEE